MVTENCLEVSEKPQFFDASHVANHGSKIPALFRFDEV
jgi:hypothetical protein